MNSALYFGRVVHRRRRPVPHAFSYRVFLAYLDLAELPGVFAKRWLWSARRPAVARFRRSDYLGDPTKPLDQAVRELVRKELGREAPGPIRLLTHLRYFGYVQNPVSFYYCFDAADREVVAVVAEITNTPWGERHAYVLAATAAGEVAIDGATFRKAFHVSPFMGMEQDYRWTFSTPGERLSVAMTSYEGGERLFDAALELERRPFDGRHAALALLRHPFMTAKVVIGIYWQALRLYLKRVPVQDHPKKRLVGAGGG